MKRQVTHLFASLSLQLTARHAPYSGMMPYFTHPPYISEHLHLHLPLDFTARGSSLNPAPSSSISPSPEITTDKDRRGAAPLDLETTLRDQNGDRRGALTLRSVLSGAGRACWGYIRGFDCSLQPNWQFGLLIAEWAEGKPCGGSGAQEDAPQMLPVEDCVRGWTKGNRRDAHEGCMHCGGCY